jgi:DNA repair protein RadC
MASNPTSAALPHKIRLCFKREPIPGETAELQPMVRNGTDAAAFVRRLVQEEEMGNTIEYFYALCLSSAGRVSDVVKVSQGSLSASLVHPREVFRTALLTNSAAIIVAHNHPSGSVDPSPNDDALTRRLKRAGKLLGVELLDHVVVGDDAHFSYCAEGRL